MHSKIFFNSEIQNVEYVFNSENPQQTTTDLDHLIYYLQRIDKHAFIEDMLFDKDDFIALNQLKECAQRMRYPLSSNGEFAYYVDGAVINLSFLHQFNYPDKMNLGEMVVVLRFIREKMIQSIDQFAIENFKIAASTINNWIYFLESL